jgi:hypothetical protein
MLTIQQHLDDLVRHIDDVRHSCWLLGKRLLDQGRTDFAVQLIQRGHMHDATKFQGIELDFLHAGKDVPEEFLRQAIYHHVRTNDHHPEFWHGFENMPEIAIAEMACDSFARSREFGTDFRGWIMNQGKERYKFQGRNFEYLLGFVDVLLQNNFQ